MMIGSAVIPNHGITVCVKGKRVNRGGGNGLEIPVEYIFYGDRKAIHWVKNALGLIDSELEEKLMKCLK